ncbi:uncharacterized protein LOC143149635 [Ptiloglossa arizonensis]|uniref:uncharacterized protein LOC143149635 n=1 Tax=Ptiloglossa arizonensis TaxID=3350558 RepID=UPI003FA049BF
MPFSGAWCKIWIYFGFVFAWTKGARPRFDTSTDMGLVLVPADAEVDSVIFRLRATDQDADFPLVFEITATITPVVRIDNLPCTLYNKVCQANVILTKRLVAGRLHDFAVRVRDTKGDSNSMQATISVTNATTPRDKIFPHIPSLIMVPEDTKPGKELDYLLVRANSWSGKPVYIELWELFTIRQRQTPTQTRGVITLIGELDFETQSVYTLTMYATDPYTEPGKDTRNIAGLNLVVIVQDVQDVPPIFTLAPPLTRINNSVQPGDIVLRVHAEDGDKGVPREIVYGLVSEGNAFTPFFNISETSGEIVLARPLEELTQITHVGAPVVLTVVAEEIRRSRDEPPAQATVVDVGFLLGEPGNTPPYFESDNYIATIDENLEPGTVINFGEQYSTKVKDEDIGKAGVFALKLENNNGTFEINPTVAERTADFIIVVRDNALIDYELHKTLSFKIVAQEVGPATNLSASVPVIIGLRDINDNPPVFDEESYELTLSENVTAGTRVIQVHATDIDTGAYSDIQYTSITGEGSKAFTIDPDTGLITVAMGYSLDREVAARLLLTVEARDENGHGNSGVVPLIINLLDVNDNPPLFEKEIYEFMLNGNLTNFTSPAFIKAIDADAEPPNNIVRYEIIHGNYENKFYLNETSGQLILQSPITKIRRKKQSVYNKFARKAGKEFVKNQGIIVDDMLKVFSNVDKGDPLTNNRNKTISSRITKEVINEVVKGRRKRDNEDSLYTLTARAYDLGIPHLSSVTQIRIISGIAMEARIMMFVVPGEQPNSTKTAETLATITGGRVTVLETRPYTQQNHTGNTSTLPAGGKKSIIVARVEQTEPGTPLVDVEKIRETLAANGVGIIGGTDTVATMNVNDTKPPPVNGIPHTNNGQTTVTNNTIIHVQNEEVTVYKAENKLLLWLLIILGLLILVAIATLIICCICPGCPFYMAPRKRRVHSSETLLVRADGRPKRHLHRQPVAIDGLWTGRKQAWSADPTRRNWQFNKRNVKNCSLPGDVAYISGQPNDVQMNHDATRLRDVPSYDHSRKSRMDEQERMYTEEIEGPKPRGYELAELDSLQRHEMERDSDIQRQGYRQRYIESDMNGEPVREQHFFREGNAEVLRLVTRGQVEDTTTSHHHHHHRCPTTLIVDGKDIILQRFIEDQKSRHELSIQDIEAARVLESHQRSKEIYQPQQPEIILVPDRLELGHRQHVEEIGPNVQRLVIDHGDYESLKIEKDSPIGETLRQDGVAVAALVTERPPIVTKEHVQGNKLQYSYNDLELARHKAFLTRLLLKKENRHVEGGILDSSSYLETQSLPGQVAIATQTERTAATQTDRHVRSRSDNDESDEDSRHRKKLKSRKKYGDGDWKRSRTLWMKSPIEEKISPRFDKRLSILRKKATEVKEERKISIEPEVLREISDSLNGNGSSYKGEEDESLQVHRKSTEQTSYKILNEKEDGSSSSLDLCKKKHEKAFRGKSSENASDDLKVNGTESTSSPEMKIKSEKHSREKTDEKSPKKEAKLKAQMKPGATTKPSFRILEKEFTLFTKKLGKLADKKCLESTGSDSTSQEKLETKDSKKDTDSKKTSKKIDASGSQRLATEFAPSASKIEQRGKQKKETAIAKTKQKLKYQQSHVMSTGSSEYDDAFEKMKKSTGTRQEHKQRQLIAAQGHGKLKRQVYTDRRETKKQVSDFRHEDVEKLKDHPKETLKTESKLEKTGKVVTRTPKLALVPRKDDNISEEESSNTMPDRAEGKRDVFVSSVSEKRNTTDSSGTDSNGVNRNRKIVTEKVIQRFSDDFVPELKMESTEQRTDAEGERNVDNVREKVGKKELGTDVGVESMEHDGHEDAKSIEKEKQMDTKRMSEDFEILLDVAQQLIESCAVRDTDRGQEEKLSTAEGKRSEEEITRPESKPAITEKVKKTDEKKKEFTDGENVMKLSDNNGMDERRTMVISATLEKPMLYKGEKERLGDDGSDTKLSDNNGEDGQKKEIIISTTPKKSRLYEEEKEQVSDDRSVLKLSDKNRVDEQTKKVPIIVEKPEQYVKEKESVSDDESVKKSSDENGANKQREKIIITTSEKSGQYDEKKEQLIDDGSGTDGQKDKIPKTPEEPRLDEEKTEHLIDTESVTKLNGKNGEDRQKIKIITEDKKEVMEDGKAMKNASENVTEEDESLESVQKQLEKTEDIVNEHKQDTEITDDTHKHMKQEAEKSLEITENEDKSPREFEKDTKPKIEQMLTEQKEVDVLPRDTKTIVETKQDTEDKSEAKETEQRKLQVENPIEAQSNGETDLIGKIDQSGEKCAKTELINNKKDSLERHTMDELEKCERQDEQAKEDVKHSEPADHVDEKIKEEAKEIILDNSEKEKIDFDAVEISDAKEETIAKSSTDDGEIKKIDFLNKRKILDGEKESDDNKIDEPQISEIEKGDENANGKTTVEVKNGDHQIIDEEAVFSDKEREMSTALKIDDREIIDAENVFPGKEKTPEEEKETVATIKIDDGRISEKENILSDKEEKVLVDATIGDRQDSEKQSTLDTVEGFKHQSTSPDEAGEKYPDEGKEITEIKETENVVPEILKAEDHFIRSKNENGFPKIEGDDSSKQDVASKMSDISKDAIIEENIDSSEFHIPKDDSQKVSASVEHDIEKGTSSTEHIPDDRSVKQGILSKISQAVHSIADKLTGARESSESTERETEAVDRSFHSSTKISKEEEASTLPTDDQNKDRTEVSNIKEPFNSRVNGHFLNHTEENTSVESTEKEVTEDRSGPSSDERTVIEAKEIIAKDSKIDAAVESVNEEREERKKEDEVLDEENGTLTKKESDESLNDELSIKRLSTLETVEGSRDGLDDKTKDLMETTLEESITVDGKLVRNTDKEDELHEPLSSKVSGSSHGTGLFQTSPLTSETPAKEKFTLDFIISETPTDSRKIPEPEKQFKSESEQTKLQEAVQFIEERSSAAEEEKLLPFVGEQSHEGQDEITISQGALSRQDIIQTKTDETLPPEECTTNENKREGNIEEEYIDVSLPLFTNIVQSGDDLDDSDSSSDISRKTTLTTRPYQTPRHRSRQSPERENIQTVEGIDTEDEEETTLTIEVMQDENEICSKDDDTFRETKDSNKEQSAPIATIETTEDENTEFDIESKTPSSKQIPARREETLIHVVEQLVQKEKQLKPVSSSEHDEGPSSSTKHTKNAKSRSQTKELNRTHAGEKSAIPKPTRTESLKTGEREIRDVEKKRTPLPRKKKSSSEESSEEKAAHFRDQARHARHQSRKKFVTDRSKQADNNHVKRSRKTVGEEQRKPSTSRMKSEKDGKGSSSSEKNQSPPKTGEIVTSKAQPKYMAWYKKNREEMEKKRAILKADYDVQLPRWLRRSMRKQKSDKDDKKAPDHASANTTPRTRRKVKPLVNVESEQLKAIVRQGRKLRRAEGGKNEDPPVQIFAPTPPTASVSNTKHHLVQHSEYKYEKVPAPFYLHPPPAPHPSPQLSPEHFEAQPTMEHAHVDEDFDSGIAIPLQGGNRLRHQQLLEKKSVFDIAYSEAAPSQLRADSTTPPS